MSIRTLKGKTVLVTGATDGLGRGLASALARDGATVLLHGRDEARGRATIEAIGSATANEDLHWYRAEFASLAEVTAMAERIGRDRARAVEPSRRLACRGRSGRLRAEIIAGRGAGGLVGWHGLGRLRPRAGRRAFPGTYPPCKENHSW